MNLHNCFIEVIIRCVIFPIVILYIIVLKPALCKFIVLEIVYFEHRCANNKW